MKSEIVITRVLTVKNPFSKVISNFKRKKKTVNRVYGTSSTGGNLNHGKFNSKLNWFSSLKNTSYSVLPTFWKSVQVSSTIINHVISSIKKSIPVTSKSISKSSDLQLMRFEASDPAHFTNSSEINPPNIPKKEAEDISYLEQVFSDWFSADSAKDNKKEFSEKSENTVIKSKKTLISKSSLQQRSRFLVHSLNAALEPGSQFLRLEEICKHLLLYPHQKTEMCKAGLRQTALHLKYYSNDVAVQGQAQTALALIGYHDPPKGQGIRILSIDGGGTRGIMAIEVLRQLEARTNKRVYELFDYMCGVSSGAILSVLLGAIHLSLDECESLYRRLSDEVFSRSPFWGTGRLVWSHAYYDTTVWVNILKKTFGEKLLIETAKCKDSPKIGVISAIMNLPNLQPFVFRNYDFPPKVQSHFLGSCQYRMWESIRASGAAPGYFEEYCLDNYLHQDGGIIVNNPAALGIHEARLLWPSEPIQCVLSLGSGRCIPSSQPGFTSTNLKTKVQKIIDSATDTEGVHVVLSDLLSPYTYFRINPYLPEFWTLDENRAEKLDQMKSDVQMYLRRNEYKFESCAMTLCIPRSSFKKAKDWVMAQKSLFL